MFTPILILLIIVTVVFDYYVCIKFNFKFIDLEKRNEELQNRLECNELNIQSLISEVNGINKELDEI